MQVEELLNKKGLLFKQQGNDYLIKCLNPEHDDSNPSMRVDKLTGIFNCFACGEKGNIFFRFGEKPNELQLRRDLLVKKIGDKRKENIGLSFPIGYVPYKGNWRGISIETYEKFEAFQHHSTDYIGRIVFPIRDVSGNIVAFQGRHTTGGTPKYKFTPSGAKLPLFPTVQPREGRVILVEGIYDVINLHDKGLTNAVCCFGTSNINEEKLSMLKLQGVEGLDVFFDGDEAGQKGAKIVGNLCEKVGLPHRNICLNNTDPGALTEAQTLRLARKLYS
jgi:DNA primase